MPFTLRAKGLVIMNFSVQLALVINNQVNPIPMDGVWEGQEWKLYCVYTCWIAIELVSRPPPSSQSTSARRADPFIPRCSSSSAT